MLVFDFEIPQKRNYVIHRSYDGKQYLYINTGNNVKCYENVCPHRFARLVSDSSGSTSLVCPFHSVAYDINSGNAIPASCRNIGLSDELALNSLTLKNHGKLWLPVNFGMSDLSIFSGYKSKILDQVIEYNFNWELLIENVLECTHCATVHPLTFANQGFSNPEFKVESYSDDYNYCVYKRNRPPKPGYVKLLSKVVDSKLNFDYHHHFIAPNIFISTLDNVHLYIGTVEHVKSNKCRLHVRHFAKYFVDSSVKEKLSSFANDNLLTVLKEDANILLNIATDQHGKEKLIGENEPRLKWWLENRTKYVK